MKIKQDFVTNSSSSSFLVSTKLISYEKMIKILKEFYVVLHDYIDETPEEILRHFSLSEDSSINMRIMTRESIDIDEFGFCDKEYEDETEYYYVDNNGYCRFDFSRLEEIMYKHNLSWEKGYCD